MQQATPPVAADPQCLDPQPRGRDQSLLDGHREHQRRLTVGRRPQGGPDRRDLATAAGHPRAGRQVVGRPPPRLAYVDPADPAYPCPARHRDPDLRHVEVPQTGRPQRGRAVEEGPGTPLEHRHPIGGADGQRPGAERDRLRTETSPPLRQEVGPDLPAVTPAAYSCGRDSTPSCRSANRSMRRRRARRSSAGRTTGTPVMRCSITPGAGQPHLSPTGLWTAVRAARSRHARDPGDVIRGERHHARLV